MKEDEPRLGRRFHHGQHSLGPSVAKRAGRVGAHEARRRHGGRSRVAARPRRAVDVARGARRRERPRLDLDLRHRRAAGARRRRGEGLRPDAGRLGQGGAGSSSGTCSSASRPAGRRSPTPGSTASTPTRVGVIFGSAIGGVPGHPRAGRDAARARARPRLAELPAERARRLHLGPARDLARPQGPELRRRLRLRDRLARRRRGRRDDQARRRGRRARGRHRGVHRAADPGRLHGHARARRRGRRPGARIPPVRRDPRRLRDGRRLGRALPRGLGARGAPGRRDLCRGARLRRLERRAPHGAARARGDRRRSDDGGRARRAPASSRAASATSTRTGPRRRSATRRRRARSRRSSASTHTSSPSPRRSR